MSRVSSGSFEGKGGGSGDFGRLLRLVFFGVEGGGGGCIGKKDEEGVGDGTGGGGWLTFSEFEESSRPILLAFFRMMCMIFRLDLDLRVSMEDGCLSVFEELKLSAMLSAALPRVRELVMFEELPNR
jgi:hypothetical protein